MKSTVFALVFLFLIFSCSKNEPYDYENHRTAYFKNTHQNIFEDSVLTVVTYNIHLGFNAFSDPWDKDQIGADSEQIENLARVLKQIDADIIALQEVPRNRYNAVVKDFVEELARVMQMNYAFGAHGYNDPYHIYPVHGEWGNAILTKYEIKEIENVEVEYRE